MLMSKSKSKRNQKDLRGLDGIYILKIVMYLVVGSQWVRFVDGGQTIQIPFPIGLILGGFFAMHEHFRIDRKIEFAILIIASFIGFWTQNGFIIQILK